MAVAQITQTEFEQQLRTALLNRTKKYDTAFGFVKDAILQPVSTVLSRQNNERLRHTSLLASLQNEEEFSEEELEAVVFNEGLLRPDGSQATTTLTFRRYTAATGGDSGLIQRGFPVGTAVGESGVPVLFVTTETVNPDLSTWPTTFDDEGKSVIEVDVSAVALSLGDIGTVAAGRINRPLRPLINYDYVFNKEASEQGRNRFTNTELVELYLLAVSSRQLSVPTGAEFYARNAFPAVEDVYEVFGTDPLLTRAATDAGAVDIYVKGRTERTKTEVLTYLGPGQKHTLSSRPVISITSIKKGVTPLVVDVDYEVKLDTTGLSGSVRAQDGFRILPSATVSLSVGDQLTVIYKYNELIINLQADAANPDVRVDGRNLLYRQGTEKPIYLDANLKLFSVTSPNSVKTLVQTYLTNYINSLGLGDDIEVFDLGAIVDALSSVDNFVITRLATTESGTGTTDLQFGGNEYPAVRAGVGLINLTLV